jgi:hypothetical protein
MTTTPLSTPPAARGQTARGETQQAAAPDHGGLRSLVADIGIPLASYYLLRKAGCDQFTALALSSVAPAAHALLDLVRGRVVSGLAVLVLVVNVASAAISFWSGNPRVMLAKDGAVSSAIGIAILLSAVAGRPLMTAGMRPFLVKGDAGRDAAFSLLARTSARFRGLERRFSVVWGVAGLADCGARVACACTLPVATTVWLSTVLLLSSIGVAIVAGGFCSVPMEKMVAAEAERLKEAR